MLNVLKVYAKTQMTDTFNDAEHDMDHTIATSIHKTQCAVNQAMQHSAKPRLFQPWASNISMV